MLKLIIGQDWTAIRDEILNRVALDVQKGKGNRILLVPELISHDMERRLCRTCGDTASRYVEVLSFSRLVSRVSDYEGTAMEECLDNGGRVVAMAAAARQLHSRLKAYASVETKPEFLTELVDAVDEFKRCCISSRDLMSASRQTDGSFSQKLEELSYLLEAYDGLCIQGKRDPRDQMTWLLEQMEDGSFAENHVFYIDGFPDFTRQHLEILKHMIRFSPQVTISLNCDCLHSAALAFEKPSLTAAEVIKCAEQMDVEVQIETAEGYDVPLKLLRKKLFQGYIQPGCLQHDKLRTIQCESEYQECVAAAEQILQLVRDGYRYRDIGVVCTDIGIYKPLLELVFHRCGIPVYISGTEDVLEKSAVVTVLSALHAALDGFEQRDVLRYLKSVFSPLNEDICDQVENYAIVWGINHEMWLKEWRNHPDGFSGIWNDETNQVLEKINDARERAINPLVHLRNRFRNAAKLTDQVQALYQFLEEIQLAERLSNLADELEQEGNPREAQILNQLWEILLSALEQMHDVLGNTLWDTETFVRMFSLLLGQYDVGTIPPVLDAVMAGPVSAMRCQQTKHLFVLGAAEGSLPGYGGACGILSDQERVALRELGVPLTGGAMEGLQAEFSDIYGVFCGASDSVTVSCPTSQPSFVFRRLSEMSGGTVQINPQIGAALSQETEAAAYLARYDAYDVAAGLGLTDKYRKISEKSRYSLGKIEKQNIQSLYGRKLNLSASQIDCQAECRLSYFLKYGLGAKERKEATVDPAEFGTYVHAVLERTAREIQNSGGFHQISLEKTIEIANKHARSYSEEHFGQMDSERLTYLFRRNSQELDMVLKELWKELNESDFEPLEFELSFGRNGLMPEIDVSGRDMQAILRGVVDRVDTWSKDGKHYFRVVDYKTGKKDFDYCDVFNGVGLQMLLYMFALEDVGENLLGTDPIPAGVQYFPARAPMVSTDGRLSDEEAAAIRIKEWKRRGLLLNDDQVIQAMEHGDSPQRLCCSRKKDGTLNGDLASGEQLRLLKRYLFCLLGKMVDEIASGTVDANPYTRGTSHNACTYCPYGDICHSERVEQRRNYKAMSAQKFWEEIEKELNHG